MGKEKNAQKSGIPKTSAEWKEKLTEGQYRVLREKGTEPAFCGLLWDNKKVGFYHCAGCGEKLFESSTKFESGTGWPSFFSPIDAKKIKYAKDEGFGMQRVEVLCAKCGGHLGHVFDDGPPPSGKRYCINSAALKFAQKNSRLRPIAQVPL